MKLSGTRFDYIDGMTYNSGVYLCPDYIECKSTGSLRIDTANFKLTSAGQATLKGTIYAESGWFGKENGFSFDDTDLWYGQNGAEGIHIYGPQGNLTIIGQLSAADVVTSNSISCTSTTHGITTYNLEVDTNLDSQGVAYFKDLRVWNGSEYVQIVP